MCVIRFLRYTSFYRADFDILILVIVCFYLRHYLFFFNHSMNIYSTSTLSNSFFNETSPLTSAHENLYEPSLFSTTTEQFYHDYQYNPTLIPILNYPEYSSNNYNRT